MDREALRSAPWQKRLTLLSTSSILVRADDAGHAIQRELPGPQTAEAFRQVIQALRRWCATSGVRHNAAAAHGGTCLDPSSQ